MITRHVLLLPFNSTLNNTLRGGYEGLLGKRINPYSIGLSFTTTNGKLVSPGILIGASGSLGKKWHSELFAGWKQAFHKMKTKTTFNTTFSESTKEAGSGYRVGINFCYSY